MEERVSYSSKRVARNTLVLYGRLIIMMLLSLYTSRVVLKTLGVEDYGIYSVVGGFVSMFSILSSSLSASISRFITFGLGKGDIDNLKRIFSSSVVVQILMALVMAIIMGSFGIWYLNHKMNIPDGRLTASLWVMACSIGSFGVGLISAPYNAAIIAHEKMEAFAYISILDAALKLLIVFLLPIIPVDKLISYSILILLVTIILRGIYVLYCRRHFAECYFVPTFDKSILKSIGGFAGWSFFGEAIWILNTQGVNLLVNSYFGVTLNATREIANQVNGAVYRFAGNFMTALDPQITKTYACGEIEATRTLVCRGSRLSYYLVLIFAIPIFLETPMLLNIWLDTPPPRSASFTRLSILSSLFLILSTPLVKAQYATGNIKQYQIANVLCSIWVFPLSWLAFRMGAAPEWSYYFFAAIYFALIFVRAFFVNRMINLGWRRYFSDVLARCLITTLLALSFPLAAHYLMNETIGRIIVVTVSSILSTAAAIYCFGINSHERSVINQKIGAIKDKILR